MFLFSGQPIDATPNLFYQPGAAHMGHRPSNAIRKYWLIAAGKQLLSIFLR
jgi:hypothetical protein